MAGFKFEEDLFTEIVRIVRGGFYVVVHLHRGTHSGNPFTTSIERVGSTQLDGSPIRIFEAVTPPNTTFMDRWLIKVQSFPANSPALRLKWTMQGAASADGFLVRVFLWPVKDVARATGDKMWGLKRKDGAAIAGTETDTIEQDTSTPLGTPEVKGAVDLTVTKTTLELKAVPPTIFI